MEEGGGDWEFYAEMVPLPKESPLLPVRLQPDQGMVRDGRRWRLTLGELRESATADQKRADLNFPLDLGLLSPP